MKRCLVKPGIAMSVLLSLAFVVPASRAEDQPQSKLTGIYCPLMVIDVYAPDCLHYCDYYENNDCENPTPDYYFGPCKDPYVNCPEDCVSAAKAKQDDRRTEFPGRLNKVPLDYMHQPPKEDKKLAEPGAPAVRMGGMINKERDCHFVKFSVGGHECFAKVIEYRINRLILLGRKDATEADINGAWKSMFVAFETEENPAANGYDVFAVAKLEPDKALGGPYAWKGRISYEIGKSAPVLILLARDKAAK